MRNVQVFAIERVLEFREQCKKASESPMEAPKGWSISKADPMQILLAAKSVRIKPGYVFRAYQFREDGNGNGFVYAVPKTTQFPNPRECQVRSASHFLGPPVPPNALPTVAEAIEGDNSPWSYMEASVLVRELGEFGAMWHGVTWGTHRILGENPLTAHRKKKPGTPSSLPEDIGRPSQWRWLKPKPKLWQPRVVQSDSRIRVLFNTYSGYDQQAIYCHLDEYQTGSYCYKEKQYVLAKGPGGFIF
jgi:hypothetical protein